MRTDELNTNHVLADEGKVLRRISDGWVAGNEIYLGYAYQVGGNKLEEPLLELPEHYEEIDESIEDEVILDEVTDLEPDEVLTDEPLEEEPDLDQQRKVTLSDYRALEDKVKMMMNLLGIN